ncbi:hypothetical protein NEMBOFW57_005747 [Staphylotrichum longicolle]|uniref:CENP-V/GFA domain-containing protein n=1 Tax=Staphylotrichum longicolle TaxID=669026 RepID=A0AAD4EXL4_9PEZI|nr:hypothetical protein NEMBOFW57_005747 [Staphylotrichum longicolle]
MARTSNLSDGSCCHCHSCRHVTGALRSSDAIWPGPAEDIARAAAASPDPSGSGGKPPLKRFRCSPKTNLLFCAGCGCVLFFEEFDEPREEIKGGEIPEGASYLVFTGALSAEAADEGGEVPRPLVRVVDHIFVGDTLDGGAVPWLRHLNGEGGEEVKVWLGRRGESEEVPSGAHWPALADLPKYEAGLKKAEGDKGNVPVRCKCGGVDLVLRAGELQREFEEKQKKGEELWWLVDPVTHKLMGSMDACESCRRCAGSEVCNWTFALLRHISFADGNPDGFPKDTAELRAAVEAKDGKPRDPRLGTLTMYASSPDVQRYFCGRCSAHVFFAVDSRPEMVDIAVGLLDAPDGARAESVISWNFGGGMSWTQDMKGTWREGILDAVSKDAEEWRIARGYPKNWRRVIREQEGQPGKNL